MPQSFPPAKEGRSGFPCLWGTFWSPIFGCSMMSGGYRDWAGLIWRLHWGLKHPSPHSNQENSHCGEYSQKNTTSPPSEPQPRPRKYVSEFPLTPQFIRLHPAFYPPSALNNDRWWVGGEAGRLPVQGGLVPSMFSTESPTSKAAPPVRGKLGWLIPHWGSQYPLRDACSLSSSGCGLAPALREDSLPPWLPFIVFNLGLRWVFTAARRLSRVAPSRGYSLAAVRGLLTVLAPLVWSTGSTAHGLSCPRHVGSSKARDWASIPALPGGIPNHWTTENPTLAFFPLPSLLSPFFTSHFSADTFLPASTVSALLTVLSLACLFSSQHAGLNSVPLNLYPPRTSEHDLVWN